MKTSQKELFLRLEAASFAVDDIKLYLDTHPTDETALSYYDQARNARKQLVDEYNVTYGPLTADAVDIKNGWNWLEQPWPWEKEA